MKYPSIKIRKIQREQLFTLYLELSKYSESISTSKYMRENLYDAVITLDILNALYYRIRNISEKHLKEFNISLTVAEAAVIQKMILSNTLSDAYVLGTFEKIKEQITKQLLTFMQ